VPEPVDEFMAALRDADAALTAAGVLLAGATVPDDAFGKLFEAHAVRDAYRHRLPETIRDLTEARAVVDHFTQGLQGGHRIVPRQATTS
jgi:hypothetical protein